MLISDHLETTQDIIDSVEYNSDFSEDIGKLKYISQLIKKNNWRKKIMNFEDIEWDKVENRSWNSPNRKIPFTFQIAWIDFDLFFEIQVWEKNTKVILFETFGSNTDSFTDTDDFVETIIFLEKYTNEYFSKNIKKILTEIVDKTLTLD